MSATKIPQTGQIYTSGIASMLVVLLALFLFKVEDPYKIGLLLVAGALWVLRPLPFREWSLLDGCVVALTLFDLCSCFYATCPIPALNAAFNSVYMLTVFFVCRRLFANESALQIFRVGSLFPIGAALLLTVCSFLVFRRSVQEAGFEDTYHFRFLFSPLGYITNIWAEVLLMLSGWISLMRRWVLPLQLVCLVAILLSFSRGAYIALAVYLLLALFFFPKTEKLRLLLPAGMAILLVVVLLPKEFNTTLQMDQTASQQQSTQSRITATEAAWHVFKERPLLGYGNRNYMYAVDPLLGQDSTKPFTSIAPNLPVQLLVEKGIVGTLLYLFVGIVVGRILWRYRKRTDSRIIAATWLAIFVKDLAQATWLNTPFLLFVSYILWAYLQRYETITTETSRLAYLIPGIALTVFIGWNIPQLPRMLDPTRNDLQEGNYEKAYHRHPEDVQLRYLYAESIQTGHHSQADSILKSLAGHYPKHSLYRSAYAWRSYQQGDTATALDMMAEAIRYTPRLIAGETMIRWRGQDSLFYHRIQQKVSAFRPAPDATPADYARYGYLAYALGDTLQATGYLQQAVHALPNLATPWLLLGDTAKYRLLLYGAFQSDSSRNELPEQPTLTPTRLLEMNYAPKVQNWYGKSSTNEETIFHKIVSFQSGIRLN